MAGEEILRVKGVSKAFGGVQAVFDVSFELERGKILGVIGPNGSGKATLVNLITGFVKPDSGEVSFKGKNITGQAPDRIANMGLTRTFQVMRPYHTLPAYKNLLVPLNSPRVKKMRAGTLGDRDAVAIDILEDIGFERDARVPYKTAGSLPLGYLKRLELGRCIALKPEVILCDKLFSGLSVFVSEQYARPVLPLVDYAYILENGTAVLEGDSRELMDNPDVKAAYFGV
jgi:ABC-type branched-subunit amino acid transport system ATPase component